MLVCSIHPKTFLKKWIVPIVIVIIVLAVFSFPAVRREISFPTLSVLKEHPIKTPDNKSRISFLQSYGWQVSDEPIEIVHVVIPQTFGKVYQNYNEIQKKQGFDLLPFCGKEVSRYTYEIKNYPQKEKYIRANLLVYRNRVIGGDVCSIYAKNGFMHGFPLPKESSVPTP